MRTGRPKVALMLTDEERQRLESLAHRPRSAPAIARRARIILGVRRGHGQQGRRATLCMSRPARSANGAGALSNTDWIFRLRGGGHFVLDDREK